MEKRQVAIVGAGISGLLACKYILQKGFHPIVFEAKSGLGGVWSKTIATTKLQTPKSLFQFSDFPWPSSVVHDFPDKRLVLQYITAYAHHFHLLNHVKFNTFVQSLHYQGPPHQEMRAWHLWSGTGQPLSSKGKWIVSVKDTLSDVTEEYVVDFLILCLGRFSDVPNIPEFPPDQGPDVFRGKVIHSQDYSAMDNQIASDYVEGSKSPLLDSRNLL